MDLSTDPVSVLDDRASPARDDDPDVAVAGGMVDLALAASGGRAPTVRALRTVGFHLGALAAFAVPAVVLWWHVWSGHPAATLTCRCGDPAQQVWFTAWPAWALAHLDNPFFSGAVNVPDGANLLSNTSGTLVGVVLAPVTWVFGPVAATNVALTLAPALSAWGCFAAARPLVTWKAAAVPAGLVYGYSSAIVSSLLFGHVSVALLVVPPLLFTTLHEIVIRQRHSVRRDGLVLAALLVVQFLISPEVLVLCVLLGAVGLLATAAVGWRQVHRRAVHAVPALGLGLGVAALLLVYPIWFGLAGPQVVTGVLFALAPLSGVPLSGVVLPGAFAASNAYVRFGGYLGHAGPQPDYLGWGTALAAVASVVVAWRRPLTWLLVGLSALSLWLSLGANLLGAPHWMALVVWMPWRDLSNLPLLKEILADQIAPFLTLFVAILLAVGLDALFAALRSRPASWPAEHRVAVATGAAAAVVVLALVPVLTTFDVPLSVVPVGVPAWVRADAPRLSEGTVVLTVPFAVSGSTRPMLWQAVDQMQFRMAGAALKTPAATGGPVAQGSPGSARRILTDLTVAGAALPTGTSKQLGAVRSAIAHWGVGEVVITGASRDPVYASGFLTQALGVAPTFVDGAWVWRLHAGSLPAPAVAGEVLPACRAAAAAPGARGQPLYTARCVLFATGHAWAQA
jgi:hypothetical protein